MFTRGFKTRAEAEQHRRSLPDPEGWKVLTVVDGDGEGELMSCVLIPADAANTWISDAFRRLYAAFNVPQCSADVNVTALRNILTTLSDNAMHSALMSIDSAMELENEACAKLCDAADKSTHPADLADAIRARRKK